jgi:hypothetical protein
MSSHSQEASNTLALMTNQVHRRVAMTYVPVYCDACARGSLVRAKHVLEPLPCTFCEEQTRPIPGPAFGDGDWLAFADIDAAVFEADLDAERASSLAAELQAGLDRNEPFPAMIAQMLAREPALAAARPALVNDPARGVGMLMTAFTARLRHVSERPPSPNQA